MPKSRPKSRSASAIVPSTSDISIRRTLTLGSPVRFSTGGSGPCVLFLHGWGLGHHAYRRGLRRLAAKGFRVVAPGLPGFGGTAELAEPDRTLSGYASWTAKFCEAIHVAEPVIVVGHSFGGAVATKFSVDFPESARAIVLLNSVGGQWSNDATVAPMGERPWWDWARHVPSDVASLVSNFASTMPSVLEDLVPNVVRNPLGVVKVGQLARNADLTNELASLRKRRLPAMVVHSEDDGVVPEASFRSLCDQLGQSGQIVGGNHSWPMTHPDLFAEVVAGFAGTLA